VENARRNEVETALEACLPGDLPPLEADIVLANILANVLVELAPEILSRLRRTGQLVLSGVLRQQTAGVIACYSPQIRFQPPAEQAEWIRLQGTRQ
jgi:ribosomal protein L11 methyltransferase